MMTKELAVFKVSRELPHRYCLLYESFERRVRVRIEIESYNPRHNRSLSNFVFRALKFFEFIEQKDSERKVLRCGCCATPQLCNWCADCAFCESQEEDVSTL
jgi:hypothetical protein